MWVGIAIAILGYLSLFYIVLSPFSFRWRALFQDYNIPEGYSILGIDVSHHQGKIDWEKVTAGNVNGTPVSFAFIKATEGVGLIDPNFNYNFYEARENGLIRGAYHFFIPGASARKQADFFCNQVQLEDGDMPPVLDIEKQGNLTDAQLRKTVLEWLKLVEQHYGVKPIIYTYINFRQYILNTADFDDYYFWIAHYYVNEPRGDFSWRFWQSTDRGKLSGIRGFVDLDIYNGSMYDLRQITYKDRK